MLSSPRRAKNDDMKNAADASGAGPSRGKLSIVHAQGGPVLEFAARELAAGLGRMLSEPLAVRPGAVRGTRIFLSYGEVKAESEDWAGEGYAIVPGRGGIALCGAD